MSVPIGSVVAATPVPRIEYVTLVVGLLFCVVVLGLSAASSGSFALAAASPADFVAALRQRTHLGELLALPLGLGTTVLATAALLRAWNAQAWRTRLRLATAVLMFLLLIIEMAIIHPIEFRLFAAAGVDAAAFAADVARMSLWTWVRAIMAGCVAVTLVLAHRAPMPAVAPAVAGGLTARHRKLLLLVGTATLFEGYDRFIAGLALPYIGHDLGADEATLSTALAAIRAGALLSIALGWMADRYGRRRLLIISVVAYTIATALTGFSRGMVDFAIFQLIATIFIAAELSLAQVVIAEEFPPAKRGFGQGVLGAFAAFGAGLAAMLFPILQRTEFGWRGMYLIGLLPLLVVAYLRRNLPETQQFSHALERGEPKGRLLDLLRPGHRGRLLVLTILPLVSSATGATAFSFASYRAVTTFGWQPGQVSSMIIGGGAVGFFGYFVFGRWSDTVGRRIIGALGVAAAGVAVAGYYQTDWLVLSFAMMTLGESAIVIAINSLTTELFPTELRATAKAWVTNSSIIGALFGLSMIGALSTFAAGSSVITILALTMSLMAPLIFLLPETRHVDLEEVDATS